MDETLMRRSPPVVAEYLNGMSPRQRAIEKQTKVLDWIYNWGYSSAEIIRRVAGIEARGYANKLVKAGLLLATPTEGGGVIRDVPKHYYTLAGPGLDDASRRAQTQARYLEIDPYKVNQRLLRHNLLAQQLTCNVIESREVRTHVTERNLELLFKGVAKRPDVVWVLDDGNAIGVEVELSPKWERDLDHFVFAVMESLNPESQDGAPFASFIIVTDSPAIRTRYQAAVQPGTRLPVWRKDERGRWQTVHSIEVPDWLHERIEFLVIGR